MVRSNGVANNLCKCLILVNGEADCSKMDYLEVQSCQLVSILRWSNMASWEILEANAGLNGKIMCIYICVNKWGMHFYSSTPRNKCRCLFQDAAVAATSMMFFPALGSLFGADLLWVCSTAANHQANITFWNILNVKTCKKKLYIWTWNQATIGWRDILWSEGLIPAPDGYDYYWWLCQNLRKGFFLWKKRSHAANLALHFLQMWKSIVSDHQIRKRSNRGHSVVLGEECPERPFLAIFLCGKFLHTLKTWPPAAGSTSQG